MKDPEEIIQQKTDYKEIILHFLSYKYLFLIFILVFLAGAYFLNKFSKPIYQNSTSVLVNKKNLYSFLKTEDLMQGLGSSKSNALENDLMMLKSFQNVSEAINAINASVSYYTEENMITSGDKLLPFKITNELYNNCPVTVKFDKYKKQPIDLAFKMTILSEKSFKLSANGENVSLYDYLANKDAGRIRTIKINGTFTFGEIIEGDGYRIKIEPRDSNLSDFKGKTYFFAFNNLNYMSLLFQRSLNLEPSSKNSSIINISLKGENPEKITDFLNAFSDVFIQSNLDKKNDVINKTIEFIDKQITNISDSLVFTENKLQTFRSEYKVTNLSFQGEKIYEKMNTLESQKAELLVKKQYYAYLKDYFKRNEGVEDLAAPSSMDVDDPILSQLIQDLITANAKRTSLLQTGSEKNLFLKDIEIKIKNLRSTIQENVNSNLSNIGRSIANVDNRIANLSAEISQLPKTERELFGIQRKFKLNDAIYTFLLQKRAEAQISKSSNIPDYEVIDPAKQITAYIVSPKKKLNYLIALFLGFFLPLFYIIINDFLRTRITSPGDLSGINAPVRGFLYPYQKDTPIIFERDTASPVAEAVRMLCVSLDLLPGENKVMTFTSSNQEDGKTFAALNVAACYSLMGYKTALVECDFRNPSLRRIFKIKEDKGVSAFLSGERSSIDPIKTEAGSNFDLYHSGKVKMHPVEFLSEKSVKKLIDELKEKYEKIIIDTTDLNDHSDLFFLLPQSDKVLYLIRHGKSRKKELANGLRNIRERGYNSIGIVVNHVSIKSNPYK